MTSFTVAMDKVQPQFSNLYWADQQHSTSEEPCHHWRCLSACRWILLKCSFFSTFHKLNDLDCPLTIAHCSTQWICLFDKEKSVFFPLFALRYVCHTVVFPVEDTGGPGRRATSEREAFDARNILKVRGNLLLPGLSKTAELQTFRLVLTTLPLLIPDANYIRIFFFLAIGQMKTINRGLNCLFLLFLDTFSKLGKV